MKARHPDPPTGFATTARNAARAVRLVWEATPVWTATCLALVLIQALLPALSALALKLMTDAAVAAGENGLDLSSVMIPVAAVTALVLIGHVSEAALLHARDVQGGLVDLRFRTLIQDRSAAVDLASYEEPSYYDALHHAHAEIATRPTNVVNDLLTLAQNLVIVFSLTALLGRLHWALPVMLLLVSVPELVLRVRVADALHRFHDEHVEAERRAQQLHELSTAADYAKELRLYDLALPFRTAYRSAKSAVLAARRALLVRRMRATMAVRTLPTLALLLGLTYLAARAVARTLTVGDLVMFVAAFQQGQASLRALMRDIAALHEDGLFLVSLFKVLDMRPAIVDPNRPALLPSAKAFGMCIEAVTFAYPNTAHAVLERVSIDLPAGAMIALVGRNGAGKSTLVKLMTRLYEPDSGRITLAGRPLGAYRLADIRRAIAVVSQDFVRYPLSLRDNVALGAAWRGSDDAAVRAALERAGAGGFEAGLDAGLDTLLTRAFPGGTNLSLGEWQKIALARAYYRDAAILVMDEPTSAMDAKAEEEVFASLRRNTSGKCLLLISHRLSTVRVADCIYVLQHGSIVEAGSHDELMRRRGPYRDLFETQAIGYARSEASSV